jgi:hypothetical protein
LGSFVIQDDQGLVILAGALTREVGDSLLHGGGGLVSAFGQQGVERLLTVEAVFYTTGVVKPHIFSRVASTPAE